MAKVQTALTASQRVMKSKIWVMRSPDFVGDYPTMCIGQTEIIEGEYAGMPMKTAFTNGRDIVLFKEFVEELTDEELRFVMLHETRHIMYRHLLNWNHLFKQNPQLANIACDYRVNADIVAHNNSGVKMPDMCLYDAKYAEPSKWDVLSIYKDLQKNGKGQPKCNGNCKSGQGGQPSNGQCTCPQGFDEHGWGESDGMSADEQRQLAQDIDQAIRQGQRLAGQMGGQADRAIGELLKIRTDWKAALRDFLTKFVRGGDELSFSRVNRRGVANGELMPGAITEAMGEIAIWADASGSIQQHELTCFLSNIVHITKTIKPIKITIGFWDTAISGHQEFEPRNYDSIAKDVRVTGGGGTSPRCIVDYMSKHKMTPEVIIILSDGYVDSVPTNFNAPVLWGIIQNDSFQAPSPQKTLHLPDGWGE